MQKEIGIFVGGEDSHELMEMERIAEAQGFLCPKTKNIVVALKIKPNRVTIRGGLTEYCVADTAHIALHFGVPEVIIDLRNCRAGIWDKGYDNNLELRKETLYRGLGRRAFRDPRLHILP